MGVTKYESCRLQVQSDSARVDKDDTDLYARVKEARARDMNLFSLFMNTFGDADRKRIVRAVKAFRNIMNSSYVCSTNMTSTSMSGTSFVTIP